MLTKIEWHRHLGTHNGKRPTGKAITGAANVLAVELHQAGTTSSDVVLGMSLAAETTFNVPWMLTPIPQLNGTVQLILNGEPGRRYAIERSTNLLTWTPLTTVTNTAPHAVTTDTTLGLSPRFYRARLVP